MSHHAYKGFRVAHVAGRRITYVRRGRDSNMGRFGGGWQWSLGFEASANTVIVNLLVAYVRIELRRRAAQS